MEELELIKTELSQYEQYCNNKQQAALHACSRLQSYDSEDLMAQPPDWLKEMGLVATGDKVGAHQLMPLSIHVDGCSIMIQW